MFTLVERGGRARSQVVPDVTAETLKDAIRAETAADSRIMSDGLNSYTGVGAEFAGGHGVIDHNSEWVRGDVHTQTVGNLQISAVALATFLYRLPALVRSRTAAKGDSTGLVVRRCFQCSRG